MGEQSSVRVSSKTEPNAGSRKSLRAPTPGSGKRVQRRIFRNDYKLAMLAEYDRCSEPGHKGALLRREALFSSIITDWRRQHREETLIVNEGRASEGGRGATTRTEIDRIVDAGIDDLVHRNISRSRACRALGRSRATHYRHRQPPRLGPPAPRARSHRAFSDTERNEVLAVLNSERFCDLAPAQMWAILLDEGRYIASISTMYRILREHHQVRERRRQARHPARVKPELMADAPNHVWSWDITRLAGPHKWNWFHCYVILDIYSRLAVGWLVAPRESDTLAEQPINATCHAHRINRHQLHLHSGNGPSMTSKKVAQLLADLGVTRSLSRPHVSNDNPFSASQFKTLKHSPRFPARFTSLAHARTFTNDFFDNAYTTNPHRFHQRPTAPQIPDITWINHQPEQELSHTP